MQVNEIPLAHREAPMLVIYLDLHKCLTGAERHIQCCFFYCCMSYEQWHVCPTLKPLTQTLLRKGRQGAKNTSTNLCGEFHLQPLNGALDQMLSAT